MLILFPHADIYLPHSVFWTIFLGKPQLVVYGCSSHPTVVGYSGRRIFAGCVQDRLLARHGLQGLGLPVLKIRVPRTYMGAMLSWLPCGKLKVRSVRS
jgi:hypothetical protein